MEKGKARKRMESQEKEQKEKREEKETNMEGLVKKGKARKSNE